MLAPTHLVFGQALFLAACVVTGHAPSAPEGAAAALAALGPDLDRRQSIHGRVLPFVSGPLEYWFGHRTLTHSLLAQAAISLAAWLLLPFGYFLAVCVGYGSHALATCSPSAVCAGSGPRGCAA